MPEVIKLIIQPVGSKICGQCCLAMLAGISVERAIEVIGHSRSTRTKELVNSLLYLGIKLKKKRLTRIGGNFYHPDKSPEVALCKAIHFPMVRANISQKGNSFHWVVLHNGTVYDPGPGYEPRGLIEYVHEWMNITSYIEILNYGKNKDHFYNRSTTRTAAI